jgi:hypothetical protein
LTMVRVLIEEKERVPWIQTTRQARQIPFTSQIKICYTRSTLVFEVKRIWCCVCYSKTIKQKRNSSVQNAKFGLCACPCFKVYHIKQHFWGSTDTKLEELNNDMCYNCYNSTDIFNSRFIDILIAVEGVWIL